MTGYRLSPAAERDVFEIGEYIERDSPRAAARVVGALYERFARLAREPNSGHRRPDLTSLPVLFSTVQRSYLVVYRVLKPRVEIVRVLHGRRDVATILATPE